MGFDLFMTVAAIVAAAVATWAILRLFLSENDDIAPSHQRITDDKPAKNHTENHTENPDEAAGATHRSDIAKRLAIATILTAPTFTVTMLTFGGITLPHWLTNPWLHAIIATPVMFYCAAPMHNRGIAALKSHTLNADSLLSLAMTIVYVYSLLACVVSWIFPAGSRNQYFRFRKHGRRAIACDFADRATPHGKESIGRQYSDRTIARKARNTISRNARNTAKHGYAYPGQHHI